MDRLGIDTLGQSEQEVTQCDRCDDIDECHNSPEHIKDSSWCMVKECYGR